MRRICESLKRTLLGLRQREQLLLLYIAGGLIPILIANILLYQNTRSLLIEQATRSEAEDLAAIVESMEKSVSIAADISKQLYFDEELEYFASHSFTDYAEILAAYRRMETIPNALRYYYHEVSGITLYPVNETLSKNEYIVHADEEIRQQKWYQETIQRKGLPYWSWQYDSYTRRNSLRMTRLLYTSSMEEVGVLSIVLQNSTTELPIQKRTEDTYLIYNGETVLHTNSAEPDDAAVLSLIAQDQGQRVSYNRQECLMTTVAFTPDYASETYTLVSFKPYRQIVSAANVSALQSVWPQIFCILIALGMIVLISHLYSARIGQFKEEMHRAASGDFGEPTVIEGKDEIAELYQDLAVMIGDIRTLMDDVVQAQIQKERIHARQREVEFKMLASQINPHFLFNTLETIRMQAVMRGQKEIAELTKMLAKLMRHSIQAGSSLQTLSSELQLVEYYLKIQDYRFHDRMRYQIDADPSQIEGLMIMPLLIQPFVENAIVHGLEGKTKDGLICVRVQVSGELTITISDNGCGMSQEALSETRRLLDDFENLDREHVGICNVNQRISLQYGKPYGVSIDSEEGKGTTVTLCLPVLTAQ
ncbi:MAG: histidine kinase [Aristaeellaceae bacterium]